MHRRDLPSLHYPIAEFAVTLWRLLSPHLNSSKTTSHKYLEHAALVIIDNFFITSFTLMERDCRRSFDRQLLCQKSPQIFLVPGI